MKDQIAQCYFIRSQKAYRFHGNYAITVAKILKINTHYVHGILACDVRDFFEAKEKLAKHGIFAKEMVNL